MMNEWFECKVKYERTMDDGKVKKVNEPYLVDALSFTEAEERIIEERKHYMSGEFQVSDIKRARYAELFETDDESADRWFKVKLTFITLDEKTGAEKKTSQNVLVQAADLRAADCAKGAEFRVDQEGLEPPRRAAAESKSAVTAVPPLVDRKVTSPARPP